MQKIQGPGPKKILTLDGGGIRGIITVEILARLEKTLRQKTGGGKDFVLADYFDYIAGTSTGAIIAAALALGWPVDQIRRFYLESGAQMFDRASLFKKFQYTYEDTELKKLLKREFGARTTLGTERMKTLLMVVLRNATTDSPWPVSNNPFALYNKNGSESCNLDLMLWQLVRASTAAPMFFPPEKVKIGNRHFVFVDGGVTTYNNPAFQAFLMATLEPYRICWPGGEDNILLVSVGTGTRAVADENLTPQDMHLLYTAKSVPSALMFATVNQQDFLCRAFGKCLCGDALDREIGDLIDHHGQLARPVASPLFTYLRYNAELTREGLDQLGLPDVNPEHVAALDSVEYTGELQRVGRAVADLRVDPAHFAGFY